MNLYKDIQWILDEQAHEFNVVVEIVQGTKNKIEYNEQEWYFELDRSLHQSTFYPFDYWFIPQTSAWDGDAIDVCLLVTYPLFPWCVVRCRPIGMLVTTDQDGEDYKVFAVPTNNVDPRFKEISSYKDLPSHVQEEYAIFFKEYKRLEKSKYDMISIDWRRWVEETTKHIVWANQTFLEKQH